MAVERRERAENQDQDQEQDQEHEVRQTAESAATTGLPRVAAIALSTNAFDEFPQELSVLVEEFRLNRSGESPLP